jgi:hypothetical protein
MLLPAKDPMERPWLTKNRTLAILSYQFTFDIVTIER